MTLIPETKDTTPQTLQNGYPAGNPAVNLNTPRWRNTAATFLQNFAKAKEQCPAPTRASNAWQEKKESADCERGYIQDVSHALRSIIMLGRLVHGPLQLHAPLFNFSVIRIANIWMQQQF